jgi:hypothetical protein
MPGEKDIEESQVVFALEHSACAFRPVVRNGYSVAVFLQSTLDKAGNAPVVFDEQYIHKQ